MDFLKETIYSSGDQTGSAAGKPNALTRSLTLWSRYVINFRYPWSNEFSKFLNSVAKINISDHFHFLFNQITAFLIETDTKHLLF